MSSPRDVSLLLPEWQGCGNQPNVARGARKAVRELFDIRDFVVVDAPDVETLAIEDGVRGLASIGSRFRQALGELRRREPARIFTVGGTCGVELAPVGYLNERYAGELAVIWIDAHADLNTPATSPSGNFHGMVLRSLQGDGPAGLAGDLARPLTARQVFLAGTRDVDPPEAEFIEAAGLSVTWRRELSDPTVVAERVHAAGFTRAYVHLDLDVLDPFAFPDALMHVPGGATVAETVGLVRALAESLELVGFSVVEFSPRSPAAVSRLAKLLAACQVDIGALAGLSRLGAPPPG